MITQMKSALSSFFQKTRPYILGVFFTLFTPTSFVHATTVTLSAETVADMTMTATLLLHQHPLSVEVVDNDASRARGLMFRQTLDKDAGMLFVFPDEQKRCFWMKNTFIPLSIAYINHQGVITDILDMQALDETPVCSTQEAMFALEVNQGWFQQKGIHTGETIQFTQH